MLRATDVVEHRTDVGSPFSWGAVIAGVFAAIASQLLLNLLGIGIGASSINPTEGDQPGHGMAVGAVIWFALAWILSLGIGAWCAAQFSATVNRRRAALQGFVVWAVASLAVVYMLSTAAGSLIGGAASVLGRTAALVGSGARASAPGLTGIVSQATGISADDISAQVGDIAADPKFKQVLADAVSNGTFTQQDRNALVNLLAERSHMTPDQANAKIDTWQRELGEQARTAKSAAIHVEDKAATGVSATAFGSFFSLLLGLGAAIAGGTLGSSSRFQQARVSERAL